MSHLWFYFMHTYEEFIGVNLKFPRKSESTARNNVPKVPNHGDR